MQKLECVQPFSLYYNVVNCNVINRDLALNYAKKLSVILFWPSFEKIPALL